LRSRIILMQSRHRVKIWMRPRQAEFFKWTTLKWSLKIQPFLLYSTSFKYFNKISKNCLCWGYF
jgi:hypothetical protein